MKKIFSIMSLLVFLFAAQLAYAQGCDGDDPAEEDDGGVKFFGFFQPQYEYHMTDPATNTFKFKRARVGLKGNIPYDFSYYLVMENSAFVSGTGNPYLLDAFISYKRFKWAKISVGSFKQPFGLEVNTACNALYTINRSMASDQFVAPQRDMGVMLLGGGNDDFVKYAFAVMNGRGLGVKDNNESKDFIGRVTFKPIDFLRIGGSFRYGYPNTADADRLSYAGELELKFGQFLLQGEYISDEGDYNRAAGGGCGSDPLTLGEKRNGAFVQAMYMTNFMLQPVVKWEMFDADLDVDGGEMYISTFGFNYFFNDWTRLQVNYVYSAEKDAEIPNDAILVQLQAKF